MKNFFSLLVVLFLSTVLLMSCAKDDDAVAVSLVIPVDDDPLPPPPPNPKIRVVLSSTQVTVGAIVAFTAFSDQEGNVTEQTTFYVNNVPVDGNLYQTTSAGTFSVTGTMPNYTQSDPKTLTVDALPEP